MKNLHRVENDVRVGVAAREISVNNGEGIDADLLPLAHAQEREFNPDYWNNPDNGVYLDVVDFDLLYNMSTIVPKFVDEMNVDDLSNREKLTEMLITRYESETLDSVPTCNCGELRYGWVGGSAVCDNCGSGISVPAERPIESQLWIRAPKGVTALIQPRMLDAMIQFFRAGGESIVTWLLDPLYRPKREVSAHFKLREKGIKRGLNFFIENFDEIFNTLMYGLGINRTRADKIEFAEWMQRNRQKLFPKAIPIPSKITFIVEQTATGKFADTSMTSAFDAINTITSIYSGINEPTQQVKESRAFRACQQLAAFYETQYRKALGPKSGWFRRHVFGSRPAHSFRAVISSLSENHLYDEVHLPWSLALSLFELHIANKLLKMGMSPNEINKLVNDHYERYHPVLDSVLRQILAEHPSGRGFPCVIQRNPSLKRLSAQRFFISKIKTDSNINTISLSVLVLKGPNKILFRPRETLDCYSPNCGEGLLKVNLPNSRRKLLDGQHNNLGTVKRVDLDRSTQRSA